MKRIFVVIISVLLCFLFSFGAFASKGKDKSSDENIPTTEVETTQDMSTPRFMVVGYELSTESLKPSKTSVLEITFKNYSSTKSIRNVKLSLTCEDGDIKTVGMPDAYVSIIYAGSTYKWSLELSAEATAAVGQHKLTVTSEYEDRYFSSYSSSDSLTVNVTQSVGLDWSGLTLPVKVVQGETETLSISLMNTGKTDLRNCKIDFEIDGLSCGGTVFVGEIPAGESKSASCNLRVSSEKLGSISGKAIVSYEDTFGKKKQKEQPIETLIEEKVNIDDLQTEEESEKKNSFWWLFLLIGVAFGGGVGCAIPLLINSAKQRKEDELRL